MSVNTWLMHSSFILSFHTFQIDLKFAHILFQVKIEVVLSFLNMHVIYLCWWSVRTCLHCHKPFPFSYQIITLGWEQLVHTPEQQQIPLPVLKQLRYMFGRTWRGVLSLITVLQRELMFSLTLPAYKHKEVFCFGLQWSCNIAGSRVQHCFLVSV